MAANFNEIKKGLKLEPTTTAASVQGDIRVDSSGGDLKYHDGTSERTVVNTDEAQTLTNKTLTTPIISQISNTGTVTLPTASTTLVGTGTTDTLTNKTIDGDNNTISNLAHGAEVDNPSSGVHGVTGSVVGTTDTQTLTNKTLTSPVLNTGVSGTAILDEDDMSSDSATQLATQQSIKAYVDATADPGAAISVTSKTGAYTATTSDYVIDCDTSGSAFTITLYAASGNTGKRLLIRLSTAGNDLTIDGNASETIDGNTTFTLDSAGDFIEIVCDGSNWKIINAGFTAYEVNSSTATGSFTSNTFKDVASLTLCPGTWELSGFASPGQPGGALDTASGGALVISTNSGNTTTDHVTGTNLVSFSNSVTAGGMVFPISLPSYVVTITASTTYYLKVNKYNGVTNFTVSEARLTARRIR